MCAVLCCSLMRQLSRCRLAEDDTYEPAKPINFAELKLTKSAAFAALAVRGSCCLFSDTVLDEWMERRVNALRVVLWLFIWTVVSCTAAVVERLLLCADCRDCTGCRTGHPIRSA